MSYLLYTNSGTILTSVATGKLNTTTVSLALVGRNTPNYGQYFNQNFVDLLTNFASPVYDPPQYPIPGQLWYDITSNKLKIYSTNKEFTLINSPVISSTQPIGQIPGEFWYNPVSEKLNFLSDNGQYVSMTTFPFIDDSGWAHNHTPILDTNTLTQKVTVLKSYGDVIGAITTSAFVASTIDSQTVFARANSSNFGVVNGLTIIGDIKATGNIMADGQIVGYSTGSFTLNTSTLETIVNYITSSSYATGTFASISYVNTVISNSTMSFAQTLQNLTAQYLTTATASLATINYVNTVMANSTQSLASEVNTLSTKFVDLANSVTTFGTYTNEITSISNQFGTVLTQVNTLQTNYNNLSTGTGATVSYVNQAISNATGSIALSIQNLQTSFNNSLTNIGSTLDISSNAAITNLQQAISNSTQSLATQVSGLQTNYSSLNSTVNGLSTTVSSKANISDVQTAISNSTASIASQLSSLQTSFTNLGPNIDISNNASITGLKTAISNSTQSLATAVSGLQTSYSNLNTTVSSKANITDVQTAISNSTQSLATAVSGLQTSYSNLNSAVSSKASISYVDTAVSNSTGSLASSLSTLQSSYSGLSSSVSTQATSINGLESSYGVTINNNGAISGYKLNSSPSGSAFTVAADSFNIWTSGGTQNPFSVSGNTVSMTNVDISGNLVVDGTLITSKVASNAITEAAFSTLASNLPWYNWGASGWTNPQTVLTASIDSGGGPVLVIGTLLYDAASVYGVSYGGNWQISVNGVATTMAPVTIFTPGGSNRDHIVFILNSTPSGTYTYSFQWQGVNDGYYRNIPQMLAGTQFGIIGFKR